MSGALSVVPNGEKSAGRRLSVVIITKDEERNIVQCLESVRFATEWIVVDSGSTDATVALATAWGAKVQITADWPGFGPQKNRALDLATGDWVLSIDADERVTEALGNEIAATLAKPGRRAYSFPRRSSYCGTYIRHSGWSPDHVLRLFERGSARFSNDLVHERLVTTHATGLLTNALEHESFRNLESVLDKLNRYSSAGAAVLLKRGKSASVSSAIGHGCWAFFRTYVLRLGFLDGRMGLVLAISNAEGTYYRYLKRWLMQQPAERTGVGK